MKNVTRLLTAICTVAAILSLLGNSERSLATTLVTTTEWQEDFGSGFDRTEYELLGNAEVIDGALRLTPVEGGVGRVVCLQKFDVRDFEIAFKFKIGGGSWPGDGMAFHWYPTSQPVMGHSGSLGWSHTDSAGYGLKFDSYQNVDHGDPYPNAIALVRHGTDGKIASYQFKVLNDAQWHRIKIKYDTEQAQVWLDGNRILFAKMPAEFGQGYFMFSASTGGATNSHWVDDVDLKTCGTSTIGYVSLVSEGPPDWGYRVTATTGCITRVVFRGFCVGTVGSVSGPAKELWRVQTSSDGGSIIFTSEAILRSGSLQTLWLSSSECTDGVNWAVGDSSGRISGP